MLVRHKLVARGQGIGHDRCSARISIGFGWKILVAPNNGAFIPISNAFIVGIGDIDLAVRIDGDQGMGVIHNRRAILSAGGKVMREAQGVPHFMGR